MSRGSDDLLTRIDAELRNALSVSPSPDFLPRVRARIRDRAAAPRFAWWRPLAPATAAVGILVLGLWLAKPLPEVSLRFPAPPAVATSPSAVPPGLPPLPMRPVHKTDPDRMSAKASPPAPGVLVPVEARIAFERSVASLRAIELVEWTPVIEAERRVSISIAPVAIRPVTFP